MGDIQMIKKADISNLITVTELMKMLWEEHDNDELLSENEKLLKSNSDAVFLYFEESGKIKDHAVGLVISLSKRLMKLMLIKL